ncbi:hypothetical protein, partial [Collinsella aerofaciens]|uniref:hypothetical protein n=1 Tax=Collinsella aerofaciens TaxID=74426 RepID=UPI00319DD14A
GFAPQDSAQRVALSPEAVAMKMRIKVMRLLRERDAQNYLLGVAKRYNIPEQETEQTRSALADYMRGLKEAGYDED